LTFTFPPPLTSCFRLSFSPKTSADVPGPSNSSDLRSIFLSFLFALTSPFATIVTYRDVPSQAPIPSLSFPRQPPLRQCGVLPPASIPPCGGIPGRLFFCKPPPLLPHGMQGLVLQIFWGVYLIGTPRRYFLWPAFSVFFSFPNPPPTPGLVFSNPPGSLEARQASKAPKAAPPAVNCPLLKMALPAALWNNEFSIVTGI